MLERRFQILLDEERYQRVAEAARARGTSIAAVIRESIDRGLPRPAHRRRAAARRILEAEGMPVPGLDDLRAELDAIRAGGH